MKTKRTSEAARASLAYLGNKPKILRYKHVVGPELEPIQMYDFIYDDYDLKIRHIKLETGIENG